MTTGSGGSNPSPVVQVLLPVCNEAASIEGTLRELHRVLASVVRVELVVAEDGSSDGTREIVSALEEELPVRFVFGATRKGYSRAVIDGLRACDAPWVLCLDSDGQCDPRDFSGFWQHAPTADLVIGWRRRRHDTRGRLLMSGLFRVIYRIMLRIPVRDPSCPYLLVSRRALSHVLAIPTLGRLSEGFWWEFVARVVRAGFRYVEVPVNHRPRAAGQTQVYRLARLPGIFLGHVWGLWQICREITVEQAGR